MFFQLFQSNPNFYLKRAAALLQEAQMARIEHQAAAEHHSALARMYAERVKRLESEVYRPQPQSALDGEAVVDERPQLYSLDGNRRVGLTPAA